MMPDAARLIAAMSLAALSFVLSGLVMPVFEEYRDATVDFGWFVYVNLALGILVGWISMGSRAGRGVSAAVTNGVTGVFLLVLWALFLQACNEMTRLAMKNYYDGAFEALAAIFQIGTEWGVLLLTAPILMTAAVGATVCGLLTEFAWRTWR